MQGGQVLGTVPLASVARGDVKHAVGPKGHAATVVIARSGNTVEQRFWLSERQGTGLSGDVKALDTVSLGPGRVHIQAAAAVYSQPQ